MYARSWSSVDGLCFSILGYEKGATHSFCNDSRLKLQAELPLLHLELLIKMHIYISMEHTHPSHAHIIFQMSLTHQSYPKVR